MVACHDRTVAKTPHHAFRIPDEIYYPARDKAREMGDNLSDIVRDALLDYIGDDEEDLSL